MSASTANRYNLPQVDVAYLDMPIGAVHLYSGIAVMVIEGTGYVIPAADTASGVFIGVSEQDVDNSGGSAGDAAARILPLQNVKFAEFDATSPTIAWVGALVAFSDDHTVALTSSTTNDVIAGRVVMVTSTATAGKVLVDVLDREAAVHT